MTAVNKSDFFLIIFSCRILSFDSFRLIWLYNKIATMIARSALRSKGLRVISRCFSEGTPQSPSSTSSSGKVNANVTGLSNACIAPATQPVGPGVDPNKSGAYKVPEYFCYNNMSYFEAEIEMSKYRCPQPSSLKK